MNYNFHKKIGCNDSFPKEGIHNISWERECKWWISDFCEAVVTLVVGNPSWARFLKGKLKTWKKNDERRNFWTSERKNVFRRKKTQIIEGTLRVLLEQRIGFIIHKEESREPVAEGVNHGNRCLSRPRDPYRPPLTSLSLNFTSGRV